MQIVDFLSSEKPKTMNEGRTLFANFLPLLTIIVCTGKCVTMTCTKGLQTQTYSHTHTLTYVHIYIMIIYIHTHTHNIHTHMHRCMLTCRQATTVFPAHTAPLKWMAYRDNLLQPRPKQRTADSCLFPYTLPPSVPHSLTHSLSQRTIEPMI